MTFVYHVWYNYHNSYKKYDYNVTICYDKYYVCICASVNICVPICFM